MVKLPGVRTRWILLAVAALAAAGYGGYAWLGRAPLPLAEVIGTPAWEEGDTWNYTFLSEGSVMGWTRREVTGVAEVNGERAFAVRETTWRDQRWDHGTAQSPPRDRDRWYDQDTLNDVWDLCHVKPWMSMSPCEGRDEFLHFPLWEGKRWSFPCCGDVISDLDGQVTRDPAGLWAVTIGCATCAPGGAEVVRYLYDAESGSIVEERRGPGVERLVLQQ